MIFVENTFGLLLNFIVITKFRKIIKILSLRKYIILLFNLYRLNKVHEYLGNFTVYTEQCKVYIKFSMSQVFSRIYELIIPFDPKGEVYIALERITFNSKFDFI